MTAGDRLFFAVKPRIYWIIGCLAVLGGLLSFLFESITAGLMVMRFAAVTLLVFVMTQRLQRPRYCSSCGSHMLKGVCALSWVKPKVCEFTIDDVVDADQPDWWDRDEAIENLRRS